MNKTLGVALVAVIVIAIGGYMFPNVPTKVAETLGSNPGPDVFNPIRFYEGVTSSTLVATSSTGASITVAAKDLRQWTKAGLVEFKQGLTAATTLTFPASSTVPDLVPNAGDRQTFCIRNATSTAALNVILAGSTGINLNVASSSATALGAANLATGEVGCITLVRQSATASSFDIDALLTVFK